MVHAPDCRIADTGLPSFNCERCEEMRVGDLDDRGFTQLMGCTRHVFELWCQWVEAEGPQEGAPAPTGLYNFWGVIMDAPALTVVYRRQQLQRRKESASRG